MRGSTVYQVQQLFDQVNEIGASKHGAKEMARAGGAATWAQIGKQLGVHSYRTADAYRDVWRAVGNLAREDGVKNMEMLTSAHVTAYLQGVIDRDLSYATFQAYAAAVEKLETALNRYAMSHDTGRTYAFDLRAVRAAAADELERFRGSRAYTDPALLVKSVSRPDLALAARIMHEGGPRVREVSQIDRDQLAGIRPDSHTGEPRGHLDVIGKGGKRYTVTVTPDTYRTLQNAVEQGAGRFKIAPDALRDALRDAADRSGQKYNGSHGLRWNFAQERMEALQAAGLTYDGALLSVSCSMGHSRGDITERYLGKA